MPQSLQNLSKVLVPLKSLTKHPNTFKRARNLPPQLQAQRRFSAQGNCLQPLWLYLPTKGPSAFSSYFVNIQRRRTPFKSPSGSFEWNPRLSCITTEIKYVNRCVLCLETSQVCTSLFYLPWNVRKILLVSFISLHKRLLLFQLGIIRKNCKYNCLSHLKKRKKKKRWGKKKKLTREHKPFSQAE